MARNPAMLCSSRRPWSTNARATVGGTGFPAWSKSSTTTVTWRSASADNVVWLWVSWAWRAPPGMRVMVREADDAVVLESATSTVASLSFVVPGPYRKRKSPGGDPLGKFFEPAHRRFDLDGRVDHRFAFLVDEIKQQLRFAGAIGGGDVVKCDQREAVKRRHAEVDDFFGGVAKLIGGPRDGTLGTGRRNDVDAGDPLGITFGRTELEVADGDHHCRRRFGLHLELAFAPQRNGGEPTARPTSVSICALSSATWGKRSGGGV